MDIKRASGIDTMNGFKRWINPLLHILPRRPNKKTNFQIKENLLFVNANQGHLCIITPQGDYTIEELTPRLNEGN
jgi:hypothetical protein